VAISKVHPLETGWKPTPGNLSTTEGPCGSFTRGNYEPQLAISRAATNDRRFARSAVTLETSWKRLGAIGRKTGARGTCRNPQDLANQTAMRNPLERFGHTCHAGGRGFESRRSR
jgi:hypothetical protein